MNRADVIEWINLAPKLALIIGATAYSAGLLIVNSYLQGFGVYTTSLLRADFVLAGLLWIFFCVLSSGAVLTIVSFVSLARRFWRLKNPKLGHKVLVWILVILGVPAFSGLLALPIFFFSGREISYFDGKTWLAIAAMLLPIAGFFWVGRRTWVAVRTWRAKKEVLATFPAYLVTLWLVIGLGVPTAYARVAYPLFLPTYGGGRPVPVRVFTDTQEPSVRKALRQDESDAGAFLLVAETSEWLILADRSWAANPPHKRVAIRIRRDAVTALQFLEQ